jgi:hypothetical protein
MCVQNFGGKTPWKSWKKRNDNINLNLREVGYENGSLMELAQGRVQWWNLVVAAWRI